MRKLATFLVAASLLSSSCGSQDDSSRQRRQSLELQCPPDDDGILQSGNNYDDDDDIPGHRLQDYSRGDAGRRLVAKIRNKPPSFYQAVVDDIIAHACDVETASIRCVEDSSPYAARGWDGACIVAADATCPVGTCERSSNCYWNAVVQGQNRTTRFPLERYDGGATSALGIEELERGSYVRGVVQFGVVGTVVGVALLLMWSLFFLSRWCCCCLWTSCGACRLCSPVPRKDGYHRCSQVFLPALLYFAALVGVLASGVIAFIGNSDVDVAATNGFLHASSLTEDLAVFLDRARVPLVNIQGIVRSAALDAKSIFENTEYVSATAVRIVDSFRTYGELHTDGLISSQASAEFLTGQDQFDSKVTPIVQEIQGMLNTLEIDLYENVDTIESAISSAVDSVDSFSDQGLELQDKLLEVEGNELGIRTIRRACVMCVFLVSMTLALAGFLGIIVGGKDGSRCRTNLFRLLHMAGFLCALLGSIVLVLASVSLSISVLWHDGCEISNMITSGADFEPIVGEKVAPAIEACFNNTNLAVAFNVTDKIDFQSKLDEGLSVVEGVNTTELFGRVLEPLSGIQAMLYGISTQALELLNAATSHDTAQCPFKDIYTKDNVLEPWTLQREGERTTPYVLSNSMVGEYDRQGDETHTEYMARIYDKKECSGLRDMIVDFHTAYIEGLATELSMTADLGVVCPLEVACPTPEYMQSTDNNQTLVALITSYRENITGTAADLIDVASTSVGETMDQVQRFLCNMNVSFVERRYDQIYEDVCGDMFGGFIQILGALWILAILLEILALLANTLSVRLRGLSRKEASLDLIRDSSEKRLTR